jgi:hypothetical protein
MAVLREVNRRLTPAACVTIEIAADVSPREDHDNGR